MQLQEVKSNSKQPSCKKRCGPKKAVVKKDVKSTAILDFTSFFTMAFLGPHLFLQLGCFGLDKHYHDICWFYYLLDAYS